MHTPQCTTFDNDTRVPHPAQMLAVVIGRLVHNYTPIYDTHLLPQLLPIGL